MLVRQHHDSQIHQSPGQLACSTLHENSSSGPTHRLFSAQINGSCSIPRWGTCWMFFTMLSMCPMVLFGWWQFNDQMNCLSVMVKRHWELLQTVTLEGGLGGGHWLTGRADTQTLAWRENRQWASPSHGHFLVLWCTLGINMAWVWWSSLKCVSSSGLCGIGYPVTFTTSGGDGKGWNRTLVTLLNMVLWKWILDNCQRQWESPGDILMYVHAKTFNKVTKLPYDSILVSGYPLVISIFYVK